MKWLDKPSREYILSVLIASVLQPLQPHNNLIMHAFATIAALLSFGASTVLSGHVLAPARPAPQAFQQRQTSREQVVRRMTHGMRRVAKRQSEPSGVAK